MQPGALRTALPALLTALALPGLVACNGPSGSSEDDAAGIATGETGTGDTETGTGTESTGGDGDGDGDCGNGVIDVGEFCDVGPTGRCDVCRVGQTGPEGSLRFIGTEEDEESGWSVASAGDVDGDGVPDVIIGAPGTQFAYVMLSTDLARRPAGATVSLADASYGLDLSSFGSRSGWSVASAGDVDGDGLDDVLVGAPYGNAGGEAVLMLAADLLSLPRGAVDLDLTPPSFVFQGEDNGDRSGWSVASAGDVDGDGLDDVLIGAIYARDSGFSTGKTYLMLGSDVVAMPSGSVRSVADASYTFVGEPAILELAGWSVASAGDVDGDGRPDVLIGAPGNKDKGCCRTGKAYVMLASTIAAAPTGTSFALAEASYSFVGETSTDEAGYSVASAGDVDGDGLADVLIGGPLDWDGGGNAGKTSLMMGADLMASPPGTTFAISDASYTFLGDSPADRSGQSVAPAGDMNGDGKADFLIGAYWENIAGLRSGATYLILSPF